MIMAAETLRIEAIIDMTLAAVRGIRTTSVTAMKIEITTTNSRSAIIAVSKVTLLATALSHQVTIRVIKETTGDSMEDRDKVTMLEPPALKEAAAEAVMLMVHEVATTCSMDPIIETNPTTHKYLAKLTQ